MIDVPEYILIGPASDLMPLVQETRRKLRGNADEEGEYDEEGGEEY